MPLRLSVTLPCSYRWSTLVVAALLLAAVPGRTRADEATAYQLGPTTAAPGPAKLEGFATAFMVAPTLLVTNEHVVRGHAKVGLRNVDDNLQVVARVLARDAASDLALLQADVSASALPVAQAPAAARDAVAVIGFPDPLAYGEGRKLALGWVRETSSPDRPQLFTLDVAVRGGNSGSPILARNGQVVGVVTGGFTEPVLVDGKWTTSLPIAGAAKLERLVDFLRKNKVPYLSHAYQGPLADIAVSLAPAVYLVEVPKD